MSNSENLESITTLLKPEERDQLNSFFSTDKPMKLE
jgi:hypothetical protein